MFTNLVRWIGQFVRNFGQGFAEEAYRQNMANLFAYYGREVDPDAIPPEVWRKIPTV